jgi:hypothetical protein
MSRRLVYFKETKRPQSIFTFKILLEVILLSLYLKFATDLKYLLKCSCFISAIHSVAGLISK